MFAWIDERSVLVLDVRVGVFRRKRHRAGRSGERIWREKRRQAIREGWRLNLGCAALVAFCVFMIFYSEGFGELLMAGVIGAILAVQGVFWGLGGHVSSISWMQGVWGEWDTEDVLDTLGVGWVVEHDIERPRGNWDHVAVSRAGVFLIDTKWTKDRARVDGDALRVGRRVSYPGASFRGAAVELRDTLHRMTGDPPWVTAVVAVWGEFEQTQIDGDRVTYLRASLLADWLAGQPTRISAERARALGAAITELATGSSGTAAA